MPQDLQAGVPFGVVVGFRHHDTMVTKLVGKAYGLGRTPCYHPWLPMNQVEGSVSSCLPSSIINLAQGLDTKFSDHGSGLFFLQFCATCCDINVVITHTW